MAELKGVPGRGQVMVVLTGVNVRNDFEQWEDGLIDRPLPVPLGFLLGSVVFLGFRLGSLLVELQ